MGNKLIYYSHDELVEYYRITTTSQHINIHYKIWLTDNVYTLTVNTLFSSIIVNLPGEQNCLIGEFLHLFGESCIFSTKLINFIILYWNHRVCCKKVRDWLKRFTPHPPFKKINQRDQKFLSEGTHFTWRGATKFLQECSTLITWFIVSQTCRSETPDSRIRGLTINCNF